MKYAFHFLAIFCVLSASTVCALTVSEQARVESLIDGIANFNTEIPKLVRLAFHDAVGGSDGCLNLANADNAGLAPIVATLEDVYLDNQLDLIMSRADFWVLAGHRAVMRAAGNQPGNTPFLPPIEYRWGRQSCDTSPSTTDDENFPDAHGDLDHVKDVFGNSTNGMGLSTRQIVALLGAHSLGQARTENSGFRGPWAPPLDRLDNSFFTLLVQSASWGQQSHMASGVTKFQWNAEIGGPGQNSRVMMLNTDMALYRAISPSATGEESGCPMAASACSAAETASIVDEYVANNTLWLEDFADAWTAMVENQYTVGTIKSVCGDDDTACNDYVPPDNASPASNVVPSFVLAAAAAVLAFAKM